MVFVDLSTAFHHLVRELVTGVGNDNTFAEVLAALRASGDPLEAGRHGHQLVGILETMPLDPLLLRLLRDVHNSTWYSLAGADVTQTLRGTRPGSPLADAIFHILMGEIAGDLRAWISQQQDFCETMAELGLDPLLIIWSDDLAIPWSTRTAEALPFALATLVREVQSQFARRGFRVNLAKGKTEAVVNFVGTGAPDLRRRYVHVEKPGLEFETADGRVQWLHFSATYRHLGMMFATTQSFEPELSFRIGMARAAFSKVSRAVLRNRHYPLALRLQFLQSLIFSKLFFGIGSWTTPSLRQMTRLRTVYHQMLRSVLCSSSVDSLTIPQLLVQTGAVDVRVRIAIDRWGMLAVFFKLDLLNCNRLCIWRRSFAQTRGWMDWLLTFNGYSMFSHHLYCRLSLLTISPALLIFGKGIAYLGRVCFGGLYDATSCKKRSWLM